jgi:hypothetical protein
MMALAWRHLRRHWRLNLAVLLCLTLASALLAGFSGYSSAIATRELHQSLDEARPTERVLLVTGTRHTFGEELREHAQKALEPVLKEWLVIRHLTLLADRQPSLQGTEQEHAIATLDVYSFNKLPERVRPVEGKLPAPVHLWEAEDLWRPPPIETVIGQRAAESLGLGVGDRVTAGQGYQRLDIVGVVEPLDADDDLWGQDLRAFGYVTTADNLDAGTVPLIIASGSMQSNYPKQPIFPHEVSWRITLNHHLVDADGAETLYSDLINLQVQSSTRRATFHTGLIEILADSLARVSRVRAALFLLTVQALMFVLYALALLASVLVARSRVELATLSARGASVWQIARLFGLENLILALPAALLLGPALALGVNYGWDRLTGAGQTPIGLLPGEAWLLSGLAAGFGWLAWVLPVWLSARRTVREPQPVRDRPPQASAIHKRYLDLYLLAFAGLLYWQLNQSGSFLMRQLGSTQAADPLLLIGPTLLLIAAALVFLRIVPYLLRLVVWPLQHLRGWTFPLGLSHLARDPGRAGHLVLLVGLTAGLVSFSRVFGDSLAHSRQMLRFDALAQGVSSVLQLNTVTLIFFSVTTFILVHLFAARERAQEFTILRAMGTSLRQWLAQLLVESVPVLLLGLMVGAAVGSSLSYVMIPYLSQALGDSLGGLAMEQIAFDWPAIARLYALLVAAYGSTQALLAWLLACTGVRWLPHIGDE